MMSVEATHVYLMLEHYIVGWRGFFTTVVVDLTLFGLSVLWLAIRMMNRKLKCHSFSENYMESYLNMFQNPFDTKNSLNSLPDWLSELSVCWK